MIGSSLRQLGLLRHGVDELVVRHVKLVDLAGAKVIQQDFDHADDAFQVRRVAQLGGLRDDVPADAVEERRAFLADYADFKLDIFLRPGTELAQSHPKHIGVEATAKAAVGGEQDDADPLDGPLHHERVLVFRLRMGQMPDDLRDFLGIRARGQHSGLGLAHLAGRHLFHRARDFLSILDTRDFHADFFTYGHCLTLTRCALL